MPNTICEHKNYFINLDINTIKRTTITSCLAFVQIYNILNYGKYKMNGSVINVPTNEN